MGGTRDRLADLDGAVQITLPTLAMNLEGISIQAEKPGSRFDLTLDDAEAYTAKMQRQNELKKESRQAESVAYCSLRDAHSKGLSAKFPLATTPHGDIIGSKTKWHAVVRSAAERTLDYSMICEYSRNHECSLKSTKFRVIIPTKSISVIRKSSAKKYRSVSRSSPENDCFALPCQGLGRLETKIYHVRNYKPQASKLGQLLSAREPRKGEETPIQLDKVDHPIATLDLRHETRSTTRAWSWMWSLSATILLVKPNSHPNKAPNTHCSRVLHGTYVADPILSVNQLLWTLITGLIRPFRSRASKLASP